MSHGGVERFSISASDLRWPTEDRSDSILDQTCAGVGGSVTGGVGGGRDGSVLPVTQVVAATPSSSPLLEEATTVETTADQEKDLKEEEENEGADAVVGKLWLSVVLHEVLFTMHPLF